MYTNMVRYRSVSDNSKKKLGKMIAEARRSKRLTQLELAEHLGVTPDGVKSWEYGRSAPTIRGIKAAIRAVLKIDVDELLRSGKLEYAETYEGLPRKSKSSKN